MSCLGSWGSVLICRFCSSKRSMKTDNVAVLTRGVIFSCRKVGINNHPLPSTLNREPVDCHYLRLSGSSASCRAGSTNYSVLPRLCLRLMSGPNRHHLGCRQQLCTAYIQPHDHLISLYALDLSLFVGLSHRSHAVADTHVRRYKLK